MAEKTLTIKSKLMIGNEVKSNFKSVIETPKPMKEKKNVIDILKTKISRDPINLEANPCLNEMVESEESISLTTRLVRPVDDSTVIENVSEKTEQKDKPVKSTVVKTKEVKVNKVETSTEDETNDQEEKTNTNTDEKEEESNVPENNCLEERESTAEEMDMFDSIDRRDESGWTDKERAFMDLYSDGGCPSLEDMQNALDAILEEREGNDEEDAPYDEQEEYEVKPPSKTKPSTKSTKTASKKTTSKKAVTDEY